MNERQVTKTKKGKAGEILGLCGPWGQRSKRLAIWEIELGLASYYVAVSPWERVYVEVVGTGSDRYLRARRDRFLSNNLQLLPDCFCNSLSMVLAQLEWEQQNRDLLTLH